MIEGLQLGVLDKPSKVDINIGDTELYVCDLLVTKVITFHLVCNHLDLQTFLPLFIVLINKGIPLLLVSGSDVYRSIKITRTFGLLISEFI